MLLKNFQTSIPFSRNLFFLFISTGSYFSKSETVVGQILQSAVVGQILQSAQRALEKFPEKVCQSTRVTKPRLQK